MKTTTETNARGLWPLSTRLRLCISTLQGCSMLIINITCIAHTSLNIIRIIIINWRSVLIVRVYFNIYIVAT